MVEQQEGLPVLKKRCIHAQKIIERWVPEFSDEDILEMASEIGLFECLSYSPDGEGFLFDFTNLQMVSFAYALLARAEQSKGR